MPTQKKIDNHLTLHEWINSHFGYENTQELLNDVKDSDEGFDANGNSPVCDTSNVACRIRIIEVMPFLPMMSI